MFAIFVVAVCGIIFFRVKNKNALKMKQSRIKNLENLKNQGFCTQDIKHIIFKGRDNKTLYFDNTNRRFALEIIDHKQKQAKITGIYPFEKIIAVALVRDGKIISQNNTKPSSKDEDLYGQTVITVNKKNYVSSIIIKIIFEKFIEAYLNIEVLNHAIKIDDENYEYYLQTAKDLYEIFENALLNNWVKKENIIVFEKPKIEKNYQDKLWELKNYREEDIVSELMDFTKKIKEEK
jgi:hypothetical protein